MILTIILFIVGFVVIIKGGDWFVDAAVWVAEITKVPKMIVGATIVSLATTLPEFFVSVFAVAGDAGDLGIGNALGSVLCNTGLILAVVLIIRPPKLDSKLFFQKGLFLSLSLVVLFFVSLDKTINHWESLPLYALFILYIVFNIANIKDAKRKRQKSEHKNIEPVKTKLVNISKFVAGAAGIVIGAELLVKNGIEIAAAFGIPENVIGVTVIAFGTSLPELVTSVTAIRKKEAMMGVGNIIGANILNFTLILSTCALIPKNGLILKDQYLHLFSRMMPRSLYVDMPLLAVMFIILLVPPLLMEGKLKRFQGIAMMTLYILFLIFVIINI